jgi:hypothetical protein
VQRRRIEPSKKVHDADGKECWLSAAKSDPAVQKVHDADDYEVLA